MFIIRHVIFEIAKNVTISNYALIDFVQTPGFLWILLLILDHKKSSHSNAKIAFEFVSIRGGGSESSKFVITLPDLNGAILTDSVFSGCVFFFFSGDNTKILGNHFENAGIWIRGGTNIDVLDNEFSDYYGTCKGGMAVKGSVLRVLLM